MSRSDAYGAGGAAVETSISPRTGGARLLGSVRSDRLIIDDDFEPPIEPPENPPEPVSVPDLAFQVRPCLDRLGLSEDLILSGFRSEFGPDSDPRHACLDEQFSTIGVWTLPASTERMSDARDRGLRRVELIEGTETFGVFLSASYIRRLALDEFDKQIKRRSPDGRPDLDGPIRLSGMQVKLEAPDRVRTTISGVDERPWPDVPFDLIIREELSVSGIEPGCDTETDTEADFGWKHFLALFTPILRWSLILWGAQRIFEGGDDSGSADGGTEGVGCSVARSLPRSITLPSGLQLALAYERLEVSSGGVFAAGERRLVARTPELEIVGPDRLALRSGAAVVSRKYFAKTREFRPPLTIEWSGDGVIAKPSEASTAIRFSAPGIQPGEPATKQIRVTVTDADGARETARLDVRLFAVFEDPETSPPVCLTKPWLPQCK